MGVAEAELGPFRIEVESVAEAAREFVPVEFEDLDVLGGELDVLAIEWALLAGGVDVVWSIDLEFHGAAAFLAGIREGWELLRF